ncbi:MAG TPA: sialate O-acetylesterase, partial [Balneolaceae bacterium]|nr:sialate O-acetylesterase [Balneolaceae bacterium]
MAQISLPDVIGSGMVLQQKQPVPVWGKAIPGQEVTVKFAGQVKKTKTGVNGHWKVKLDPMKASSTPRTMTITGSNIVKLDSVLVGEVWFCSGQSNMQLVLWSSNKSIRTTKGDSVIASAHYPMLKLFNVSRAVGFGHKKGKLGTWQACTPQSVKDFSAAAYYFGHRLQEKLGVPVGIINDSYGGSQAEAWTPQQYLSKYNELKPTIERTKKWRKERPEVRKKYHKQLREWHKKAEKAKKEGKSFHGAPHPPAALRDYRIAGSIYWHMVRPIVPYAIKGAFWYQGESNAGRAWQYGLLLPTMIHAWRDRWGEGKFPMGIVQLPNFRNQKKQPQDAAWSHLRDAQRVTADTMANTGLIVTIDIGKAHNIHPPDKLDVGKRMRRWALSDVYGYKMTGTGPMYKRYKVEGSKVMVWFSSVGKGLKSKDGEPLHTFAIAGKNKKWHWAKAKIVGKNKVKVWSDAVPHPVAVRYAFNNNPKDPNLTNNTGLPA